MSILEFLTESGVMRLDEYTEPIGPTSTSTISFAFSEKNFGFPVVSKDCTVVSDQCGSYLGSINPRDSLLPMGGRSRARKDQARAS